MHTVAEDFCSVFVKDPGGQCWHAVVDSLLYCPTAHAVHDTAPDSLRVDVVQPASQTAHAVIELVE